MTERKAPWKKILKNHTCARNVMIFGRDNVMLGYLFLLHVISSMYNFSSLFLIGPVIPIWSGVCVCVLFLRQTQYSMWWWGTQWLMNHCFTAEPKHGEPTSLVPMTLRTACVSLWHGYTSDVAHMWSRRLNMDVFNIWRYDVITVQSSL